MLRQVEPQWNSTACHHWGRGLWGKPGRGYGLGVMVRQYIKSGLTITESTDFSNMLFSDVFVSLIHGKCFWFYTLWVFHCSWRWSLFCRCSSWLLYTVVYSVMHCWLIVFKGKQVTTVSYIHGRVVPDFSQFINKALIHFWMNKACVLGLSSGTIYCLVQQQFFYGLWLETFCKLVLHSENKFCGFCCKCLIYRDYFSCFK